MSATRGEVVKSKIERAAARAEGKAEGAALVAKEIQRWYGATAMPAALAERIERIQKQLGAEHVAAVREVVGSVGGAT
jgi:hypothetical protein